MNYFGYSIRDTIPKSLNELQYLKNGTVNIEKLNDDIVTGIIGAEKRHEPKNTEKKERLSDNTKLMDERRKLTDN